MRIVGSCNDVRSLVGSNRSLSEVCLACGILVDEKKAATAHLPKDGNTRTLGKYALLNSVANLHSTIRRFRPASECFTEEELQRITLAKTEFDLFHDLLRDAGAGTKPQAMTTTYCSHATIWLDDLEFRSRASCRQIHRMAKNINGDVIKHAVSNSHQTSRYDQNIRSNNMKDDATKTARPARLANRLRLCGIATPWRHAYGWLMRHAWPFWGDLTARSGLGITQATANRSMGRTRTWWGWSASMWQHPSVAN